MKIMHTASTLALVVASLMAADTQAQPTLLWSDEFEGTIGVPDPAVWSYDVGYTGWGNNELQLYTSTQDNAMVQDGLLKIIARKDDTVTPPVFTSARIKTENTFSFTYGTLEARIKVPNMDAGLWPAFWTMGSEYYQVGWPNAGEVDIMEMGQGLAIEQGLVNHRVVSAVHWDVFGQYATYARSYDSPVDLTQDFHIYKFDWTPERMVTYVDDNWIWEMDINGTVCPSCSELHKPHYILFNIAVGGGFTSGGTSSSAAGGSSSCASSSSSSSGGDCPARTPAEITAPFPGEMLVDWVRLYDNGYTQVNLPTTPAPTNAPVVTPAPTTGEPRAPDTPAPVTPPPVTPPPITLPPITAPPITAPPITAPPVTALPVIPQTTPPPVTTGPVTPQTLLPWPVTRAPGPQGPSTGSSGKGGKGGVICSRDSVEETCTGGSRSYKRQPATKGLSKSKAKSRQASKFAAQGEAGSSSARAKSKAKGSKARYNRSGTTACMPTTAEASAGTKQGADFSKGTSTTSEAEYPPPEVAGQSAANRDPAPPATTTTSGGTTTTTIDGLVFEPVTDEDRSQDGQTLEGERYQIGPTSLVAVPESSAGGGMGHSSVISLCLSGFITLGVLLSLL
jgi:beta-glucanase (GH16 family)